MSNTKLQEVLNAFNIENKIVPYGNGHINDTFLVRYVDDNGKKTKYILSSSFTQVEIADTLSLLKKQKMV